MIARTVTVDIQVERVDSVIEAYRVHLRPIHAAAAGLRAHYVLANRAAGRVVFVGVWESDEAIAAARDELEEGRSRLWREFGEPPAIDVFEVADSVDSR